MEGSRLAEYSSAQLASLMGIGTDTAARALERRLADKLTSSAIDPTGAVTLALEFHAPGSSIYAIGQWLTDLDRELRRTSRFLNTQKTTLTRHAAPIELESSAKSSSHDFLVACYGWVQSLLLSRPIQASITLGWFWDHRPKRWGISTPETPRNVDSIHRELSRSARRTLQQGGTVAYRLSVAPDGTLDVSFQATTLPTGA